MGILTQSGRGFPIHACTVGTSHYYRHAAMGEKIATQSFPHHYIFIISQL